MPNARARRAVRSRNMNKKLCAIVSLDTPSLWLLCLLLLLWVPSRVSEHFVKQDRPPVQKILVNSERSIMSNPYGVLGTSEDNSKTYTSTGPVSATREADIPAQLGMQEKLAA